jgi:hypothetical protein
MRRLVLLPVLVLTIVGCGGDRELDGVKQAVGDTATVPKDDVSCSKRSEHRYDCTTPGGVWSVGVKAAEDGSLYFIEGSQFSR